MFRKLMYISAVVFSRCKGSGTLLGQLLTVVVRGCMIVVNKIRFGKQIRVGGKFMAC